MAGRVDQCGLSKFEADQSIRNVTFVVAESDLDVAVGDGKAALAIPLNLNGMLLDDAIATVHTPGAVGGNTTVQIRRRRGNTDVDMLSTRITVGVAEYSARDGVINNANRGILTGDLIFIDVDTVNTTPPKGLFVTVSFRPPP